MLFAKMCETAAATSWAVTLYKVVVGSASRRSSGDIEIAVFASLIATVFVVLRRMWEDANRIQYKEGAIDSKETNERVLLKPGIV